MTYATTWGFLQAQIPELGPLVAQRLTQRAWEKLRDERDAWSFLVRKTSLNVHAGISAGAATVTFNNAVVATDATAKAALDAQDTLNGSNWRGWVFRIGSGAVYRIASYNTGTGEITLDRVYFEESAALQIYSVRQAYLTAPANFKAWVSVVDTYEDFALDLETTTQELDRMDPLRTAVDTPTTLASFVFEATQAYTGPLYELYPHASDRRSYPALYRTDDYDWVGGLELPVSIPQTLIEDLAMVEAYEWCEANRTRHKELAGADWRFLIAGKAKAIEEAKRKARNNDANLLLTAFGSNYLKPKRLAFGANYLQSHAPYTPQ